MKGIIIDAMNDFPNMMDVTEYDDLGYDWTMNHTGEFECNDGFKHKVEVSILYGDCVYQIKDPRWFPHADEAEIIYTITKDIEDEE